MKTVEERIAAIATQAHGIVTYRELLAAGVTKREVEHRVRCGVLIRLYRGVYRVGHEAPSVEASYMAAVKAGGDGALLCGCAAAHLLGLIKSRRPLTEVVSPRQCRINGLAVRQARGLSRIDGTICRGIPTTTVPRTLVDLAASLPVEDLTRACHEAGVRYRTTPRQVEAVLVRLPRTRGARKLRRIMSGDEHVLLSKLEKRFLELLDAAGLPLPRTNRPAGGRRVDCRWLDPPVTVELDSYRYHHSRHAWEQDRRREREAHARGDQFRRYTWGDVFEQPRQMLAELRELLIGRGSG